MRGICMALLLGALSQTVVAQQDWSEVEGIWRDIRHHDDFISIHINGDRIVLVDLARLEWHEETLQVSYMGRIADSDAGFPKAQLKVLDASGTTTDHLRVDIRSSNDLLLHWNCGPTRETCVVGIYQELEKAF